MKHVLLSRCHLRKKEKKKAKLDDSFTPAQFISKTYDIPYSFDRSSKGGGLLFYIREDIPWKFFKLRSDCNIESMVNLSKPEVNLLKQKWFIYQAILRVLIASLMNTAKCINFFVFFLSDFNANANKKCVEGFCNISRFTSLIKNKHVSKISINPNASILF